MHLYVILLFPRNGTDEVVNGFVREWNDTGYSLKYDTICKYWLKHFTLQHHVHYSFVTYIIHSSLTSFILHVHRSFNIYITRTSLTLLIKHVHHSLITYILHSSRTLLGVLVIYICIYCVLCCLYCAFVLFRWCVFILICFFCTSVRTTATERQLNCS